MSPSFKGLSSILYYPNEPVDRVGHRPFGCAVIRQVEFFSSVLAPMLAVQLDADLSFTQAQVTLAKGGVPKGGVYVFPPVF